MSTSPARTRDFAERIFWTGLSVFLGAAGTLAGAFLVGAELSEGMIATLTVAATAVANGILIIVRWRVSQLPDPGQGLPGYSIEGDI